LYDLKPNLTRNIYFYALTFNYLVVDEYGDRLLPQPPLGVMNIKPFGFLEENTFPTRI
jgi:hypothetical protein